MMSALCGFTCLGATLKGNSTGKDNVYKNGTFNNLTGLIHITQMELHFNFQLNKGR